MEWAKNWNDDDFGDDFDDCDDKDVDDFDDDCCSCCCCCVSCWRRLRSERRWMGDGRCIM